MRPASGSTRRSEASPSAARSASGSARSPSSTASRRRAPTADDDAAYFDGGLTLGFGLDAQLDVRAGVGLTDASADWLFGLGFARRW